MTDGERRQHFSHPGVVWLNPPHPEERPVPVPHEDECWAGWCYNVKAGIYLAGVELFREGDWSAIKEYERQFITPESRRLFGTLNFIDGRGTTYGAAQHMNSVMERQLKLGRVGLGNLENLR